MIFWILKLTLLGFTFCFLSISFLSCSLFNSASLSSSSFRSFSSLFRLLVRRDGAFEEADAGLAVVAVVLAGTLDAGFGLLAICDPLRNGFSFNEGFAEVSGSPNLAAGDGDGLGVEEATAGGVDEFMGVPQKVQKRSLASTADQSVR